MLCCVLRCGFEVFTAVGGLVNLPCDRTALYCHGCWDRALNSKFDQIQAALCPSCRCPVRVDFNPETRGLTFRKSKSGSSSQMRQRLQEQVKPVQIQLLEQYGQELRDGSTAPTGPPCICGSHFVYSSVLECDRKRIIGILAKELGVAHTQMWKSIRVCQKVSPSS